MNYREKIRKAIECPQFGNETYGEWGALRFEQKVLIKRLLDELESLDSADNYFKKVYLENQELKKKYENAVADYETTMAEKNELKKQLEQYKSSHYCSFINICKSTKIANYIQQKEFIKYMRELSNWYSADGVKQGLVNGILQKYEEIIGDNK